MTEYFNRSSEKERRRQLRRSMPNAEVVLWSKLKRRQLLGCKFRRQYSVGSFVLDFFSAEIRMGIELDGDSHLDRDVQEYDRKRQQFIECFGIHILRIPNAEVHQNLDGVLEMIGSEIIVCRSRLMTP